MEFTHYEKLPSYSIPTQTKISAVVFHDSHHDLFVFLATKQSVNPISPRLAFVCCQYRAHCVVLLECTVQSVG